MRTQTLILPMLTIDRAVYDAMLAAAFDASPLEACGLLGGRAGRASACYELHNTDASAEHYSMRAEDQFAAVRDMRGRRLALTAIWHSHPATPARMSAEDLRLAYTPGVVYVIVSLAAPDRPELRGFTVEDGTPHEVPLVIVTAPPARSPAT